MKVKTWIVQITCYQKKVCGTPRDHFVTYEVTATTAGIAMGRGVQQYLRDTKKRIGKNTYLNIGARPKRV